MKNIVLCGFMGTGKTEVGRTLARLLGRPFVDLDDHVTAAAGMPVDAIFAAEGEPGFRRREQAAVAALAPAAGLVLATGGGTLLDPANRRLLAQGGHLVLLQAAPDVLAVRLAGDATRPLLAGAPHLATRIADLLAGRAAAYGGLDHAVDTGPLDQTQAAIAVARAVGVPISERAIPVVGAAGHAPLAARGLDETRVVCGRGAVLRLGDELHARGVRGRVVLCLAPPVARHHGEVLQAALAAAGHDTAVLVMPDGDDQKTFARVADLVDELAALGCDREACVVAAGGGVVGDLAGFAAAIYMRGVALAMVPTTLLAMVDAHLGGKTGVNTAGAKNLAGAFHPPLLVVADPVLLATLPDRELACGLAEVVKTALIGDADLFATLEAALIKRPVGAGTVAPRRDAGLLDRCVAGSAAVKAGVVARDPWELGERRVLNLGHTLGHALEAQRALGLAHGEAVAIGLSAACRIAADRGLIEPEVLERTRRLLRACGLPTGAPPVADAPLRACLLLDKKRRGEVLRFVLPLAIGRVAVVEDVTVDEALGALDRERTCASS